MLALSTKSVDFLDHKTIKEQMKRLVKKYSTHNTFIGFN
ncbi:hypothetical protein HPSA50_0013 [Helicobacter pylori SouthAfrica50]|uniref:Uncharacterized protein n=1 Tax=Helicobacter pylori SouthAfrica50 TaxID=1352357 RepID=T2SAA0_HELPX|nr:hypothetical protein HPSA50_0013 [Helicobacter pylori SouthAfrica50]